MNETDKPMAILYIYPAAVPGRHEIDEATGKELS